MLAGSRLRASGSWHLPILILLMLFARPASAQQTPPPTAPQDAGGGPRQAQAALSEPKGVVFAKLLAGGAIGLALHESGHLAADWAFEEHVSVKKVGFHGIPFFAITHTGTLSPRREFTVSSAGFWSQYLYSEQILTHHPGLRLERGPVRKGMLAFHMVTSVIYAGVAFAKAGPAERDTLGMADSIHINERWLGALILAPALLDSYRYFHSDANWAAWTSRGVKIGTVALIFK